MADIKTIEDLTNAFGPSGFEEEVVKAVQKHCEGLNLRNDAVSYRITCNNGNQRTLINP